MKHRKVHMIYMAAGNSRRFQGNKLLYTINGKALYRYGLETLIEVQKNYPDTTLTVVVQEWAIYDSLWKENIHVVYNPDSINGASYTIKAGILALENVKPEDFVMFVVADQPGLTADTVKKLMNAGCDTGECASVKCENRMGNPVMFSAALLPELMELRGDEGGRTVLRRPKCVYVEAGNERELEDIDCREDLKL